MYFGNKGSAEDELNDRAAKYAKLRPMRVEMYGMNWNANSNETNPVRATLAVAQYDTQPKPVPIHSIHCNGQRGDYQIENDTRRSNYNSQK